MNYQVGNHTWLVPWTLSKKSQTQWVFRPSDLEIFGMVFWSVAGQTFRWSLTCQFFGTNMPTCVRVTSVSFPLHHILFHLPFCSNFISISHCWLKPHTCDIFATFLLFFSIMFYLCLLVASLKKDRYPLDHNCARKVNSNFSLQLPCCVQPLGAWEMDHTLGSPKL